MAAKINLAPDVRLDKLKVKRRNFLVTAGAIIAVGLVLVFILIQQGYRWSRVYGLDSAKKKIADTENELNNYKDIEKMVVNIENGIKAVNEIDSSSPKWSKFLPVLEQSTPNDVRFIDFSQDGNRFTAKAEGLQIQSIGRLIKSLDSYEYKEKSDEKTGKRLFQNVTVDSYEKKDGKVQFTVVFEMERGVLW